MENFTENDFRILKSVIDRGDKKKGLVITNGTTIEEIANKTNLSDKKVRDTIKKFKEMNYVTEGIKKVRTRTYVLTKEGFNFLNNIRKNIFGEEL